ncbi:hypothetical protein Patl1_37079 [Pistacia atlantica]|nr:hypothetical protein Patl1_37079 [Pistacia atlantica]
MIGRATYSQPMRLWHNATGRLTDFQFSFVIDSDNRTAYGDGIAFFPAPQGSKIPISVTKKEWNSISIGNTWDPPGEHVGINIDSMRSVSNITWWGNISIRDGRMNEAWIKYNASTQNLSVVFTGFRDNATVMQSVDFKIDLRLHLPELVTFGFSAATGNASAIQTINSWEFNSSLETDEDSNRLAVGWSIGGVLVVASISVWFLGIGRKKEDEEEEGEDDNGLNDMDDEFEKETGPKKFSYKELANATNDFNDENKL